MIQEMQNSPQREEKEKKAYFLIMLYPDKLSIDREDEFTILSELKRIEKDSLIIMLLNSLGGNIYAACKIIDVLRTKCSKLTVVVPYWAKSAASLMCLGTDEIIMGAQSELGPLDKPFEHPHLEGQIISACDVVDSIEYLQNLAIRQMIDTIGIEIRRKAGLSRKDSIEIASKMATDLVIPILSKEDPRIINQCFRMLLIAQRYGMEFLEKYMLNGAPSYVKMKIPRIIYNLVWNYPDHSFAIRREEASKKLNLNIVFAENFERWDDLWKLYLLHRKDESKFIKIFSEEEFNKLISPQK